MMTFIRTFFLFSLTTVFLNVQATELVDIDDPERSHVLTSSITEVKFPLSQEELQFIEALKNKVIESKAAGLAAPQLGVAKSITAFQVTEEALLWREDVADLVPQTILVNPSYEPVESEGKSLDWEGCFSGKNHYGKIWRYNLIKYKGKDINGNDVEGEAFGFLARLLQHEIDHCHHKMCIHNYDPDSPHGSQADLMPTRKIEVEQRKRELGLKETDYFPLMEKKNL